MKNKGVSQDDPVGDVYGNSFMDRFHDYRRLESLWRYQHRARIKYISENIDKYDGSCNIALDAGSGKGPNSLLLAKKFRKVYSFEYSADELSSLKKNIKAETGNLSQIVDAQQVDLQMIPLANESVQFIVCSEVLEHVPDYRKAIQEISRVCVRGGCLIFSMPNINSLYWQYSRLIYYAVKIVRKLKGKPPASGNYDFEELARHWKFSCTDIENIVTSARFSIIERRGIGVLIYNEGLQKFLCNFGLFPIADRLDTWLGKKFPRISAIYFLVLIRS
ncbi:MAG: methyltransferase domain-containing protein [Pseudomonadales bacterium]|nr:methyltransferase domain-containing protein [Pseudomonadales bacterium]